ncbi:serine/threonine protein kinase [Verminephrobacter aporrectodeae subsp. tuberculatae]|uniref:protein kinase domain-containing protein n=1 Tax=Verminephrobacter aporrectodeae TaxID=1110389 RepID=UPI0022373D4E|nr:protein kinase [Verminephrobacter aporrectodeae]MCW5222727.1 serine/threonine protein kinase [Verminephrobacter aporrectodeae subsp. tuberculatae]MCW5257041.1 serine/threonine protein kinase [Verminephrobacter aporrectodeae subsp. tuberculatae]MCW5288191.1 serine/threonine protein kinase [Verminephrobacter aporrectodeae subsp. tuberculatae]
MAGLANAHGKAVILARGQTYYSIPDALAGDDGRTYIVGEHINSGGNAVVHACYERLTGDSYAVKFQVELRNRRRERFEREIQLLRELDDPHIISFVASGTVRGTRMAKQHHRPGRPLQAGTHVDDVPFVVLSLAAASLAEHARSPNQIPNATYLGQFIGLARALTKINCKALHRDIKPENILVVGETWAISDFGLCDLTVGGVDLSADNERIGPAFWMSPEALNKQLGCGDLMGEGSDVFQLASVFWYVACGRHPTGIVRRDDWKGPEHLYPVIERALFHTKEDRFTSSEAFKDALIEAVGRSTGSEHAANSS